MAWAGKVQPPSQTEIQALAVRQERSEVFVMLGILGLLISLPSAPPRSATSSRPVAPEYSVTAGTETLVRMGAS